MWYNNLDRTKPYLRSYRNVNLNMDQYDTRLKGPRVASWHINVFRRIGKHYSGVRSNYKVASYSWISMGHYTDLLCDVYLTNQEQKHN